MKQQRDYDFNVLERAAKRHIEAKRFAEAISIYFFMADGDPSRHVLPMEMRLRI